MSQELEVNFRSLKDVIVAEQADAPLVIRAVTPSVPPGQQSTAGPIRNDAKLHLYVRLDGLPRDLAERVKTAVEALSWG